MSDEVKIKECEKLRDEAAEQEETTRMSETSAEADEFQSTQSERDIESASLGYWAFNPERTAASPAFSGASSFANDSQHSETSMSVFDLNILVCGKSGNGKSTISNFLIGYERFLTGFLGTNLNEPLHCEVGEAKVKFRSAGTGTLRVIDTPGLFDFEADPQECLSAMSQVVYSVPGGVHAFVFVLPFNQTLTDDDAQILLEMSLFFSKSILNYCFFLLNSYRSDFTPPDDLTDSLPEVFKKAVAKSSRVVWLVNPMETSDEVKQDLRRKILSDVIENLNRVGKSYDSAMLTCYHARRQEESSALKYQRDLNQLKIFEDNELARLRKENDMRAELMTRIEFESFNDTGIGRKVFIEVEKECKRRQFTNSTCPVQ